MMIQQLILNDVNIYISNSSDFHFLMHQTYSHQIDHEIETHNALLMKRVDL